MKKVFALFFSIILLFPFICYSEDFTIHAGTQFGETMFEVKKKETLAFQISGENYLLYQGVVAGYNDTFIMYYFNDEDKLYDVDYQFGTYPSMDITAKKVLSERLNKLRELLTTKYGEQIKEDTNEYLYLKGYRLSRYDDKKEYTIQKNSWIVPQNNYYIKIDLYDITKGTDFEDIGIEYYIYTNNDLDKAIKKYTNMETDILDDI